MNRATLSVVLLFSAASASAQPPAAGVAAVDAKTIQSYRLTTAGLQKMQAAARAFARAARTNAEFRATVEAVREYSTLNTNPEPNDAVVERMTALEHRLARDPVRLDRLFNGGSIATVSARIARVPPLAGALKAGGLTPEDFVTFQRVVSQSVWENERRATGVTGGALPVVSPENMAFAAKHRDAIVRLRLSWLPFWE